MPAKARTFGLDETFIEPQVLPPPPTRHALLVFLIALAAILHIGTVGWSDIHNGAEGYYAGAAREMLRTNSWLPPDETVPPLVHWLLVISYKIFGVTAVAARLPMAGAIVASVALTFLIGERLASYWRGFAAGLVHLCCLGTFVWGRMLTPEPIFAMFVSAAIFCAIRGYQRARERGPWFAGVWICAGFAYLANALSGLLYPAAVFLILALFFREARLRFRQLLRWQYILLFLVLALPWHILMSSKGYSLPAQILSDGLHHLGKIPPGVEGISLPRFLLGQVLYFSPALLLVLPGTLFAIRRIVRPHEFDFADALPLVWMAVGFLPLLFASHRQDFQSISMWGAFALWTACAWDRTPNGLRLVGLGLVALLGTAAAASIEANTWGLLPTLPLVVWPSFKTVTIISWATVVLASCLAAYFTWRRREELALMVIMLAMAPVGLSALEGLARYDSHLSLADAARFLQPRLGETGEVLFEGSSHRGSSLGFYLDRPPLLVTDIPRERGREIDLNATMEKMGAGHPVYLIIHKDRVPHWQGRLTERFHIYHQITTCGSHVVLNNKP